MRHLIKLVSVLLLLSLNNCTQKSVPLADNLRVANVEITPHASNQALIGQDFLAAQHPRFQINRAIKYARKNSALGSLDFTFGSDLNPISRLLSSGNYDVYRVHIINTVCVRNGNCGRYEIGYGFTVASFSAAVEKRDRRIMRWYRERVRLYNELSRRFPLVKFWISPALEHNLTQKAYRTLADVSRDVWPEVQLVNSAQNCRGERYKGALRECHGNVDNGDLVSLDGTDVTDIDVVDWVKRTITKAVRFVWSRSYNCRNQGPFEDPRTRTSCPKEYQFEELSHITDARPPKPNVRAGCRDLSPEIGIWKQFAEDKGIGDARANLPVALVAGSSSNYTVISQTGKVLGQLDYFGKFTEPQWNRYYSGIGSRDNGYGIEKKGKAVSSSPWVYLKQGSRCYGPFIPGRRAGRMRD